MQDSIERDENISQESEINIESSLLLIQANQMSLDQQSFSQQPLEYNKVYFLHGPPTLKKQFPFYLYLRQKYKTISLEKQLEICHLYFNPSDEKIQVKKNLVESAYIKQLNKGINLFNKLPINPLLFVRFCDFNQGQFIVLVSNSFSEIIHYQIFPQIKRKNVILLKLKRRLHKKGHPLMFILDETQVDGSALEIMYFQNLSKNIKFHYIRMIKTPQHRSAMAKKLLGSSDLTFGVLEGFKKITLQIEKQYIWVYSSNKLDETPIQKLREQKEQFQNIFTRINFQHQKVILEQTNSKSMEIRLNTLNALYFNYLKATGNNKTQFIKQINKLESRIMTQKMGKINIEVDHYPERLLNCRRCKNCEILGVKGNKKSKFKCMACSRKFQIDIPLCLNCFGDFHQTVLPKCRNVPARQMKRVYSRSVKTEQEDIIPSQKNRQNQRTFIPHTVRNDVIKLHTNLQDIKKIMKQIQQEQPQCIEVVKKFNESLFLSTLDCFNIMFRKMAQNDINDQVKKEQPDK